MEQDIGVRGYVRLEDQRVFKNQSDCLIRVYLSIMTVLLKSLLDLAVRTLSLISLENWETMAPWITHLRNSINKT